MPENREDISCTGVSGYHNTSTKKIRRRGIGQSKVAKHHQMKSYHFSSCVQICVSNSLDEGHCMYEIHLQPHIRQQVYNNLGST